MAKELSESQVLSRIENLVAKLPSVTARTRVLQYLKEKAWDFPQSVAKGTLVAATAAEIAAKKAFDGQVAGPVGYLGSPQVTGLEGCVPHVPT